MKGMLQVSFWYPLAKKNKTLKKHIKDFLEIFERENHNSVLCVAWSDGSHQPDITLALKLKFMHLKISPSTQVPIKRGAKKKRNWKGNRMIIAFGPLGEWLSVCQGMLDGSDCNVRRTRADEAIHPGSTVWAGSCPRPAEGVNNSALLPGAAGSACF